MLHTVADELTDHSPESLLNGYYEKLQAILAAESVDQVATETGVGTDRLAALADGSEPTITIEEAAAILAVDDANPEAEAIVFELRDHLLMGMTTAVLDVDTVAANAETDLTGQEIQQAIEGRTELTLARLAAIQSVIETRLEN